MLVATHYFPAHIKGRVLGTFASSVALAAGVGPILGGYITGTFHWRYLFLVSMATVLTIPFFRKYLPEEEKPRGRFDLMGALLAGGGVACLLFSVTQALWWLLLASAGFFLWLALHITRVEHPFVRPSLFLNSPFRAAIITTMLSMGTVFGMMFMTPIMLRDLNALDADMIGLVMFPGAMSAAVLGTYGGTLADRYGSFPIVFLGMGFLLAGFLLLSTFAGLRPVAVALTLMVCYVGFSFLQASLAHSTSMTLAAPEMGSGMGLYNLFFFMSGALSAAGLGKLMDFTALGFPLNPLCPSAGAVNYSNLFVLLALMVLSAACLFGLTMRGRWKAGSR
jgi:DHA2 family metal-tetracycline-proton antiporter-like MFS transporter